MNRLTEESDEQIYQACTSVRTIALAHIATTNISLQTIDRAKQILKTFNTQSEICVLINERKWTELFSNKDWLNLLRLAEQLNSLYLGLVTEDLQLIAHCFPDDTARYLISTRAKSLH